MSARGTVIPFQKPRQAPRPTCQSEQLDAMTAELQAIRARGQALQQEIRDLLSRQSTLAQEFEHRLLKSLEVIASQLSLQSQTATTPEAAAQLSAAARRIAAVDVHNAS